MFRKVFMSACLLCFGAFEASTHQSLAAQERPVRAPRIPVQPTRPGDFKVENLRPDLVVKEMRLEGDKAVHVLVANNGTADAGEFNVDFEIYRHGTNPILTQVQSLPELKAGEEKWLAFVSPFKIADKYNLLARPAEYHLADLESFIVKLDVHYYSSQDLFKTKPFPNGDVIESDESNNSRRIQKSDMAPWPPPM